MAETTSPTGYEPKDLSEVYNIMVKPMFFHRPSMTLTYVSGESIGTLPPESDLDDDQIRNMLVSPLYLQVREAGADRHRVYHSFRENSVSSSSHFRESAGKPDAEFSHKRKSSRETFSERENVSSGQLKENVNLPSGSLIRKKVREQFLKNKEIIYSQEQNLKSWSKNVKLILLTLAFVNFKDKLIPIVRNWIAQNCGYETSRRDQPRLHEESAQREKALRDTRIRNVQEVEELKRAQEMRIDEFSRNELRVSHATIQELTSQIQELQEGMNCMNDSREFQDVESMRSGELSHVPSRPAIVPSLGGMLSRDPSVRLDTLKLLGISGNVLDSPRAPIDSSSTHYRGRLSPLKS